MAVMNWTGEDLTLDVLMKDVFKDEVSQSPFSVPGTIIPALPDFRIAICSPQAPSLRASHFHTEDLWAAPHYAFADSPSDFGANALPEVVTEKLSGVQVRKHAARVWKFTLKEEKERKEEEAGRRERQREEL